jgi:hypothetical protein
VSRDLPTKVITPRHQLIPAATRIAAVLDGRQYPCADQFRQAGLVDLRAEAAWGSFSNTATWLWLRRVRLCFELGALQERCWGRLLAALAMPASTGRLVSWTCRLNGVGPGRDARLWRVAGGLLPPGERSAFTVA